METYTKDDYLQEIKDFYAYVNAKAEKHGILKSKDEEEREKKEKADRLEKTTETYISSVSQHDKAREMIEQLKFNGYDLKFSAEMNSQYTHDTIIINVSSENPDDLPQEEVLNIVELMDKFISYHSQYNKLKEIYDGHWLADNPYFISVFEYVAAKECCRRSSYIKIEDVKRLMLMSGVFMFQMGLCCTEGRINRVFRKFKDLFNNKTINKLRGSNRIMNYQELKEFAARLNIKRTETPLNALELVN